MTAPDDPAVAEENAALALRLAEEHCTVIAHRLTVIRHGRQIAGGRERTAGHIALLEALDRMRYLRNCLAHAEAVLRDLEGKR